MHKFIKIGLISVKLLWTFSMSAQNFDEYQLKVHFIHSFCQFVDWQDPLYFEKKETFNLVILGENPFDNFINIYFRDQYIKHKPVIINYVATLEMLPEKCDVLFISRSEKYRIKTILNKMKNKPTLTIGDTEAFGELGVHINMYIKHNKIRFEINEKSMDSSQLKAQFRLIQVAKIINPIKK